MTSGGSTPWFRGGHWGHGEGGIRGSGGVAEFVDSGGEGLGLPKLG